MFGDFEFDANFVVMIENSFFTWYWLDLKSKTNVQFFLSTSISVAFFLCVHILKQYQILLMFLIKWKQKKQNCNSLQCLFSFHEKQFLSVLPILDKTYRSSHQRCSVKKVFLEILQNSQENTCARDSFWIKLQAWGLKKSLWHRCFPVNFANCLKAPFLQNTSGRLLQNLHCFFSYLYLQRLLWYFSKSWSMIFCIICIENLSFMSIFV